MFYVGLHMESHARHFDRCCISIKRLLRRKSDFAVGEWLLDSGAFTELRQHGRFLDEPEEYAARVIRWAKCGNMAAAVSQDYMCEPIVINGGTVVVGGRRIVFKGTGLSVPEHQRLTIERYDRIKAAVGAAAYVLPVLQGYWPEEYVAHVGQYGDRLAEGQWVGVGSVCKRNVDVEEIEHVLMAVKKARPDLRLHGFGVKITALESSVVRDCLYSADSMAWSYNARMNRRGGNAWQDAKRFADRINSQDVSRRHYQPVMW